MIPQPGPQRPVVRTPPEERGRLVRAAFGLLALHLLLALPAYSDEIVWQSFLRLPIELPLVLLALFAAPARLRRQATAAAALAVAVLVAAKLANLAVFTAYARPFNAFLHLHLIPAGFQLLAGSAGVATATLATAVALVLLALLGLAIAAALRWVRAGFASWPARIPVTVAVLMLAGYAALDVADVRAAGEKTASAATSRFIADQFRWHWQTFGDLARFRDEIAHRPPAADNTLSKLAGRDVVLVFIESYGRTAIESPRFAPVVGASLRAFEAELDKAGFAARSGWLASSTIGGQSWLAHATLLSGLRVDGQGRYDALARSGRPTLIHDFAAAGWDTVGVMPGITTRWPEAASFGYRRLLAAADLGYAGTPFGWISMPDQYTLSALQRLELGIGGRPPVMVTVVLISSHLPWTPIPHMLPWDAIADGTGFGPETRSGTPVETIWNDLNEVRDHYARSIDYVLHALAGYIARFGRDQLFIVLGDHQPAPFVGGDATGPDVPVHIVARDPGLLAALDGWGWSSGMVPGAGVPAWPMESFRSRFVEAFTPAAAPLAGKGDL